MAIVSNKGNAYEPVDHHWHADANEVHGSGGDGVPGANGSDMIIATGGTIARSLSDWCADILYDDSGAMIALGNPGLWHVKRGTYAAPITTSEPTLRIDKYESISLATQPNPFDSACNASIVLIGEGLVSSQVQTTGLWVEQRGGGTAGGADVGGVCAVGWLVNDVPRAGGNYLEGRKAYSQNIIHAVEVRATNASGVADAYNPTQFSKSMGVWATPNSLVPYVDCAGAFVAGYISANKWDVGFAAIENSITSTTFRDDSSSVRSILIFGTHLEGINLAYATITSPVAIAIPNNKSVVGLNAAGAAFINCISVDTSSRVAIGQVGTTAYSVGPFTVPALSVNSAAAGTAQVDFLDGGAQKWLMAKHTDNSFYFWNIAAAGMVLQFGASATRTVGFFGATPAVQQTIGAALSTGGAETNTNLATRINQLRTAMINLGLAV